MTDQTSSKQISNQKKFVDLANARVDEQRRVMTQIVEADHCPFCQENLRQYHHQPILKTTPHWLVTTNQWPYKHTLHHFLIIYRDHIENLTELEPAAGAELFEIVSWLQATYNLPGGGWAMRFGDTDYSAGSVNHLHVQLIVPDINHPDFEPARFKIGKEWARRRAES